MELPNLANVATSEQVETIGSGKFNAAYINWSRTLQMLRDEAPGWMPAMELNEEGSHLWEGPVGGYLMIYFQHVDGSKTASWPQSVMDHRNNPIPFEKIHTRDITDTHRRGTCAAAAGLFGLCYELWAKMDLESGYERQQSEIAKKKAEIAKDKNAKLKERAKQVAQPLHDEGWSVADWDAMKNWAITSLPDGKKGDFDTALDQLDLMVKRWTGLVKKSGGSDKEMRDNLVDALASSDGDYQGAFDALAESVGE